jgi:hypothetical protein
MAAGRLKACLPYLAVLAAAAVLWALTNAIVYDARPGQLGPTFWPRVAIVVMAAAAAIEIARILVTARADSVVTGIGEALEDEGEGDGEPPRVPRLLLGGIILTLGFGVLVTTLGFLLATFLFLVAFMYLGRYRNHAVVWTSALLGTLLLAVIFLKVVYVSLPRGTPPFDQVTRVVVDLLSLF